MSAIACVREGHAAPHSRWVSDKSDFV